MSERQGLPWYVGHYGIYLQHTPLEVLSKPGSVLTEFERPRLADRSP